MFVPDGADPTAALARTTDLGIVAHPDDLEFLAIGAIGACLHDDERWFGGVVCTDGGGSTEPAEDSHTSGSGASRESLVNRRGSEQREAATIGHYGAVVQLGHPSAVVLTPDGQQSLVDQLDAVLRAARPTNVFTHNPVDKHLTHLAVVSAAIKAVRRLPLEDRPSRLVGVEAWRDLDWLPDHEKVRMDVTGFAALAEDLAAVFTSQLGVKRYDLAATGRRRANATYFEPRAPDSTEQVVVAMDLTPLARNDDVDPVRFVRSAVERFRDEAVQSLEPFFEGWE